MYVKNYVELTRKDIPSEVLGSYKGRKFKLAVTPEYSINGSDLTWQDGSKTEVSVFVQTDGKIVRSDIGRGLSVFSDAARKDHGGMIPPNVLVIEYPIFCGKTVTPRLYVCPGSAWLPRMLTAGTPVAAAED
jgi:hypothetical protein